MSHKRDFPIGERRSDARAVCAAFFSSRLLILAVILLASQATVVKRTFDGRVTETTIELRQPLPALFDRVFVTGDAEWFRSIAVEGYAAGPFEASRQRNWAFFPGWPLLLRAGHLVAPIGVAGVLLADACFFAGLFFFRRIGRESGFSNGTVDAATVALAFFPSSYFFTVPLSESLFFLLSAAAIDLALRRRWPAASLLAAAASATRVTGILLVVVLILLHRSRERRWFSAALGWLVIAPAGLLAFMAYLQRRTGNAFAFADLQASWNRHPTAVFAPLAEAVRAWPIVSVEWNFIAFQFLVAAGLTAAALYLAVTRRFALAFFVAASVALALSSGSLQSMSRYALSAWPAFYAAGAVAEPTIRRELWIAVSSALLGVFCCLFALGIDIALA